MKWIDKDQGKLEVDLPELHDMLVNRTFIHEETPIMEVSIVGNGDHIKEIDVLRRDVNNLLEDMCTIDCNFHDVFEDYCTGIEPGLPEHVVETRSGQLAWDVLARRSHIRSDDPPDDDVVDDEDDGEE